MSDAAIATHRTASEKLYRIKDKAFEEVARRLRDGVATTEFDIQQKMVGWFTDEGLVADSAPCVSAFPSQISTRPSPPLPPSATSSSLSIVSAHLRGP